MPTILPAEIALRIHAIPLDQCVRKMIAATLDFFNGEDTSDARRVDIEVQRRIIGLLRSRERIESLAQPLNFPSNQITRTNIERRGPNGHRFRGAIRPVGRWANPG